MSWRQFTDDRWVKVARCSPRHKRNMATKQNLHQVFASHVASRSVPLQMNTCQKHQTVVDLDDVRISHLVPLSHYSHKIEDQTALTLETLIVKLKRSFKSTKIFGFWSQGQWWCKRGTGLTPHVLLVRWLSILLASNTCKNHLLREIYSDTY